MNKENNFRQTTGFEVVLLSALDPVTLLVRGLSEIDQFLELDPPYDAQGCF